MVAFQWTFLIVTNLLILYKILTKYIKKQLSLFDFMVLLVIDLIISCVFIFPTTIQIVASWFGIGRGVDFIIYVSLFMLFFIILNIYFRLEKLREEITSLNRALTLQEGNNMPAVSGSLSRNNFFKG